MPRVFILLVIISFLTACSNKNSKSVYESKGKYNQKLVKVDSVIYKYKKNNFIGRIALPTVWKNYILLTDTKLSKVFIFNKKFKLIKSVGRKGRGPGEYKYTPIIVLGADSLKLFDVLQRKVNFYDENFNLDNVKNVAPDFYYLYDFVLEVKDGYVFSAAFPYPVTDPSYYRKYKSLIFLDKNFNYRKEFLRWDDIYYGSKYFAYASDNIDVLLSPKEGNTFLALQKATYKINVINENLETVKIFGRRPRYYKKPPPNVKWQDLQSSLEKYINYKAQTTEIIQLNYDNNNGYTFVEYINSTENVFYKRDTFAGKLFLQVYDQNEDCIFDERINGMFLFPLNNKIYILEQEKPAYFKIGIYRLVKI